ncbi:hypothetical protein TI39_contig4321g00009 [Zymoseptoria brevis]|uniref:Apple domain-containing protein n=1 Tax=Zymoseptoria brevis TaxID=1047168 RepID=A0A0F4G7R0_9PEZI|nr:hypothetical protein TI39_contig4321g00009 [Zymoseptoria brevis]
MSSLATSVTTSVTTTAATSSSTTARSTTTSTTSAAPLPSGVCNASGNEGTDLTPVASIKEATALTPAGCLARCKLRSTCQAFAVDDTTCYLYNKALDGNFGYDPSSKKIFYDAGCSIATTSSSRTTSTTTLDTSGTTTSRTTSSPEAVTSDSTSSTTITTTTETVVFPTDDPSFEDTIVSYEDFTLDAVDMGVSPVTGLFADPALQAPAPCVLNPTDPKALFELLTNGGMPLIANAAVNSLGPLPSPTSEAAANALGPPEDFQVPQFFFQQPADAPEGLYDILIVAPTPKYVARAANGDVVLTDSSTGAAGQIVNERKLYTTIFGVSCQGFLSITQDGQPYTATTDKVKTTIVAGSDGGKSMMTLPVAPIPSSRRRRRSLWNEGSAPRCPKNPDYLTGQVRVQYPPVREPASNGCGGAASAAFVPNFSFGGCCSRHDLCYDDCKHGNFENCNNEFHSCMRGQGCESLNHWYTWAFYLTCLKTADFYYWTVTGDAARGAFNDATKDRCECKCPNNLALCSTGGQYACTDIFGSDSSNCGACGRTCPPRASCGGGKCVCPIDTCGNRCTDFQSSPTNCGSCGNKCASGYCYKGQCYDPPPGSCIATNGIKNGDFVKGSEGWTFSDPSSTSVRNDDPGASDGSSLRIAWSTEDYNTQASFETEVRVCPGTDYDLTFLWRRGFSFDSCQVAFTVGDRQVFSQPLPLFTASGDWLNPGPVGVSAFQAGQSGVRQTSASSRNLYVTLKGTVSCTYRTFFLTSRGVRTTALFDSFALTAV